MMNKTKTIPMLFSDRLVLTMPGANDVNEVVDYYVRNREHIANSQALMPESFYTSAHWSDRLEKNQEAYHRDESLNLFVFLRQGEHEYDKRVIASVNFTSILRRAAQFCYLGYSLDQNYQGQGLMTEAAGTAIDFAFQEMNVHRIMANYVPHNLKSAGVLSRLGFVVEGYARDYLCLDGVWQDHVLTSRTNTNWRQT
jgi:[ribosomal protein S5]-alanine N-acetyltransferase